MDKQKENKAIAKETPKKSHRKSRSKRYREAQKLISKDKFYPLAEAIKLTKKTSVSRFTGNLEAHLIVNQKGEFGEVKLPYSTGKQKRVTIADEKVISAIKAGKIDFDVLIASPKMMPKLLPLARILGPKGLMPNPKNGTLTKDPEKAMAKFVKAGLRLRTEKKAPVLHLVLGKLDQNNKELTANVRAVARALNVTNIKKLILVATMGPAIKVNLQSLQE